MPAELKPFRVLSLDGGGMRGLYTATVLHTLMRRFRNNSDDPDGDVGAAFDIIAGTSTGGILALALAFGASTQKVIDLYAKHGEKIFVNPMPSEGIALWMWLIKHRLKPANSTEVLRTQLTQLFNEETIGSLYQRRKIGVVIPAVKLASSAAWVFKTAHDSEKHRDDGYSLVDVALATSAAPMFLPVSCLKNPDDENAFDAFADGGLWANNPVLVGLIEALHLTSDEQPIEIISIGTCTPPSGKAIKPSDVNLGVLDWKFGAKALELSLDAQSSGYNAAANFLIQYLNKSGRDCRLIRLPQTPPSADHIKHLGLDKAHSDAIAVLSQLGRTDGNAAHGWALSTGDNQGSRDCVREIFSSLDRIENI